MKKLQRLARRVQEARARPGSLGASLIQGVLGTAGIKAGYAVITFATSIVMAKSLGPAGYGVVSYVIALVHLLSTPSELGIPGLAVREVAVANARKDWGRMRSFIRWAQTTIGLVSLFFAAVGATVLLTLGYKFDPERLSSLWLGLILIPLVSFNALRGSMLRGLRKVLMGQLPDQIIRPVVMLVLLLALPLVGYAIDSPFIALAAHITSVGVAFCCGLVLFYRNKPAELSGARIHIEAATWFRSSIPFGLTALMQLINGRTDILMLGFFRSDAEVGIYRVASQMAAVVVFGLQIINAIQGPHIAHLFSKGDMHRLQLMVTRSSQLVLSIALPSVIVIILFGQFLTGLLYGERFAGAYWPLVIICVGQLVNASIGSVGSLLNMTGHERDTTKSIFIGASVNIVLNLALTPIWGIFGAAIATTATLIVWNFIMWRKVRARIGIEPSPFFRRPKAAESSTSQRDRRD